jgi:transcription elongation GreA/GreB family factor
MQKNTLIKSDVRSHIQNIIIQKIEKLERFMEFTLEASREVKKTPKYDSIREEMQEEIYQMQKQMASLNLLRRNLGKVLNTPTDRVQIGSIVFTNKARFYISVSLGEFFFEGDRFYAISEESPMAKTMFGKKPGDAFVLNNISQVIEQIW